MSNWPKRPKTISGLESATMAMRSSSPATVPHETVYLIDLARDFFDRGRTAFDVVFRHEIKDAPPIKAQELGGLPLTDLAHPKQFQNQGLPCLMGDALR